MEIRKKQNRFGTYYKVAAILQIRNKKVKIWQDTNNIDNISHEWRLSKSQMIILLKEAADSYSFNSWLFRSRGHFDAMVDGWVSDEEDFKPINEKLMEWLLYQLKTYDYHIYFYTGDRDRIGNPVEPKTFWVFDTALYSFDLKPNLPITIDNQYI